MVLMEIPQKWMKKNHSPKKVFDFAFEVPSILKFFAILSPKNKTKPMGQTSVALSISNEFPYIGVHFHNIRQKNTT